MYTKKVFITGGSGDICASIIQKFKSKKFEVYAPSRTDFDLKYSVDSSIKDCDFDILINCAGINEISELSKSDINNLIETMNVNFFSPYKIINSILPHMVKSGYGRIINIGSIWQKFTKQGRSSYSISKSALHALTKSVAVEYGKYGILCNTVSPGFIDTKLTRKNNTDDDIHDIIKSIPNGRLGKTDEVADLVYYLSVENTFINGQNIFIDGGYSCLG